jgi:hypothetical protein
MLTILSAGCEYGRYSPLAGSNSDKSCDSNIWDTSSSKNVVRLIGQKYGFSQRLISLMIYAKEMQQHVVQRGKKKNTPAGPRNPSNCKLPAKSKNAPTAPLDPEKALTDGSSAASPAAQERSPLPPLEGEEIELYLLLKNTVNFTSIDHTDRGVHKSFACHRKY